MSRFAFKMYLVEGQEAEYERRHDEIWPDVKEALHSAGVYDYSISLDEETNTLFALQNRRSDHQADAVAESPVMRRWFEHMHGLLKTNPDGTPIVVPLREVFYMA
jgi:L-rhamnose mutarotase